MSKLSKEVQNKIVDLLYKNATIYLDRKYQRYLDLCNLNNSRALEKSKV